MSLVRGGLTGVIIALWRILRNNGRVFMRTSDWLLRSKSDTATIMSARMRANGNFSGARLERLLSVCIIATCRSVCFANFFIISILCKSCGEPECRCWPGVTPDFVAFFLSFANKIHQSSRCCSKTNTEREEQATSINVYRQIRTWHTPDIPTVGKTANVGDATNLLWWEGSVKTDKTGFVRIVVRANWF